MRNSPQFQAMGEVILVCWFYSKYKSNSVTRRKNPLVDEGGAMMYDVYDLLRRSQHADDSGVSD